MKNRKTFEKYYSRLSKEGILKALILGLIVGFAVDFCVAFGTWFISGFNGLYVSLAAGVAAALIATPVFYYKLFRPTSKKIAERIDRLGLDERMITMLELEGDDSYIALRQREDAEQKLGEINEKRLKFRISRAAIAIVAIVGVLGISMTTVNALSASGIVPDPGHIGELIDPPAPPTAYMVSYMVEEGGYIEGETDQIVFEGEDATTVLAVADDGWMFSRWSDEPEDTEDSDPSRTDTNVHEDLEVTAIFQRVEETNQNSNPQQDPGDSAPDEPGDTPPSSDPSDDPSNSTSGNRYDPSNQIIDGETDYRTWLESGALQDAMDRLQNNETLTDEERKIIESFFGIIP